MVNTIRWNKKIKSDANIDYASGMTMYKITDVSTHVAYLCTAAWSTTNVKSINCLIVNFLSPFFRVNVKMVLQIIRKWYINISLLKMIETR